MRTAELVVLTLCPPGPEEQALLFGDRNALHAMHAALVLELGVDLVAADEGDDFLESADARFAAGGDFHLPVLRFGEAGVHAENLGREEGRLVATGARADFEDDVLVVVRILRQEEDAQFLFDAVLLGLELGDLHLGHFAEIGILILEHGTGLGEAVVYLLPLAIFGRDIGKFTLRFGDLTVLIGVADDGRIGHLLGQFVEASFELIKFLGKLHGEFRR